MMEPVAYISEYGMSKLTSGNHYHGKVSPLHHDERIVPLVRLSDAEARIAELEAEVEKWKRQPHYIYIGKDGKAVKARDIEDRAEAAESLLKEAREALDASSELIDRMMHVHVAPDECTSYVEGSRRWFMENGGSLAAIADQQAMNRRALKEKP